MSAKYAMHQMATKVKRPAPGKMPMFMPPAEWFKAFSVLNKRSSPFPMEELLREVRGYGRAKPHFLKMKKKLGRKREVIDPNTGKKYSVAHSCVPCHQAKKTCSWNAGCLA